MAKTPTRNRLADATRYELAQPHDGSAWRVFFQHLVDRELDDAQLLNTMHRFESVWKLLHGPWSASKFRGIVRDDHVMQAIRATVAHARHPTRAMVAIVAHDGSVESADALVQHVQKLLVERDEELDELLQVREHAARTPALDALFAELAAARAARNAASPVLALAAKLGLELELLWFVVGLEAPHFAGEIVVDSRAKTILHWVAQQGYRRETDPCDDVARLPLWIATTGAKLGVTLTITLKKCSLRGRARERLIAWLRGSS